MFTTFNLFISNYHRTQVSLSIVKLNNQVIRYRTYLFDGAGDTIAMFVESIGKNSEKVYMTHPIPTILRLAYGNWI